MVKVSAGNAATATAPSSAKKPPAKRGKAAAGNGGAAGESRFQWPSQSGKQLQHAIAFDIETAPALPDDIWEVIGFADDHQHWFDKPFDPSSVPLGQATKQETINRKIDEARAVYEQANADRPTAVARLKADMLAKANESAALDASTGRVVVVGYFDAKEQRFFATADDLLTSSEAEVLREFWGYYSLATCLVGHNVKNFDLPFLIQRSWILGVPVPGDVMERDRYFNSKVVDTMERWACGRREFIKLDTIARALGVGRKNGSGKDFHVLWKEDHKAAMAYLENDLKLTYQCAAKLIFA
jgi:hypothetical protein